MKNNRVENRLAITVCILYGSKFKQVSLWIRCVGEGLSRY